jgi:MarR family transcriptional regulator, organic hydroperoxide resistance regulator
VPTPWSDTRRLEHAHAYQVSRLGRLLRVHLARTLEAWGTGLSAEQFFLLFRLHERDGRRQSSLVDPVLDDRPNISRHVAALERRGLVRRSSDPDDGRARLVHLTPAGRAELDRLMPRVLAVRQELFGGLDPQDFAAFGRVLTQLTARLGG